MFQLDDRPFVLVLYDNVYVPLMPTCRNRRSRPTSATSSPPLPPCPLGLTQSTLRLITLIIVSFGVISLIIRNQPRGSSKISPDWPTDGTVDFFFLWKIALFFNCAYVALINVDCSEVSSTIEIPHTSLDDTRRIFIRLVYWRRDVTVAIFFSKWKYFL